MHVLLMYVFNDAKKINVTHESQKIECNSIFRYLCMRTSAILNADWSVYAICHIAALLRTQQIDFCEVPLLA